LASKEEAGAVTSLQALAYPGALLAALALEIGLLTLIAVKKERFLQDRAIEVFRRNLGLAELAGALLLVSLGFHILAEVAELYGVETGYPAIRFFEDIHLLLLLGAMLAIGALTYLMGWER